MRPITVTAGPIAAGAASGTAVATGVPSGPNPQQLLTGGAPAGGSNTSTWQGTGQIVGNLLTVASTVSGAMSLGRLMGNGLPPNCQVTGPGPSAGQWYVSPAVQPPTAAGVALRLNNVVTLDAPRQLTITSTSDPASAVSYTIYGTNAAGQPIIETNVSTGAGVPFLTQQSFATVTQIVVTGGLGNMVSFGTSATATSPWVMFDPYTDVAVVTKAVTMGGTPTWTIQISNDDPNSPTNPVPASQVNWQSDPDATFVGATTPRIGGWAFVPLWARLFLTTASPAGSSATATFVQQGG